MSDKLKYYQALKASNGCFEEIELGEQLGFEEDTTRKIISSLLSEYRIKFETHGKCSYRVI